ncbi:MAG: pyridine nucleotide-disulfide oxidoreductase [Candidatus Lokiarchaeota archaeon]|nr:pyridine nucleotide-disulfide oxidoreductase [Candidatus Lokiarchaeota archaeon]MBD3341129.1 pyridine nucleotide-disulfide oxidoreductase [Candidatus Lokiarchaeota archaeon]
MEKVVIVGGVAGGATAAARLRRLLEDIEIIVLERGDFVSFANCGLPYYIGSVIKTKDQLELMTPEKFLERFNIDVRVKQEALSINPSNKEIKVKNLINENEYYLKYDYLILSPGASPIIPPFKGLEEVPTFTLRTIPDSVKVREFVEKSKVKHATIVGGGYIGLEMAENLKKKGIRVKIVEMLDQVLAPLDKEMAQFVHQELILNGVCLQLGDAVDSFKCSDDCNYVIPKSGKTIETDMIIISIGVRPENKLAIEAGIELGPKGHIIVDKHMRTSDPSIYAVGDAVQVNNFITHNPTAIPLAGPANKQGRIAADNIAGRDSEYKGVLGASVLKVFDQTISFVGLSEKQLKNSDRKYEKIYIHPNNHASYYPGAIPITMKLLFEKDTGIILGAQAIGGTGTEKRIDVISTVIKYGGSVYDLEELELTYAPPYSSAKDPVNMAGYVASNVLRDDHPIWHWNQVEEIKKNNSLLLDVRTPEEYKVGTIDGAVNINDLELRSHLDEISKDKNIFVFCEVGFRGYLATRLLLQKGYNAKNLTGGYKLYKTARATVQEIAEACGPPEELMDEIIEKKTKKTDKFVELDACGLSCPGPLNAMIKGLENLPPQKRLKIYATDPGFKASVEAYVQLNDEIKLLRIGKEDGKLVALLQKGEITQEELKKPITLRRPSRKEIRNTGAPPVSEMSVDELYDRLGRGDGPALVIDVRTEQEFKGIGGYIKGVKNIPLDRLMTKINDFENYKNEEIVLLCAVGGRSSMAAQLLARAGFKDLRNLSGGMSAWRRAGYPIERDF